jgi:hypothetical protein
VTARPPVWLFAVLAVCVAGVVAALFTGAWWGPVCALGVLLSGLGIVGHYSVARERKGNTRA